MTNVVYPGKDLEAMAFAVNYHKWILQAMRPYLGRRVVEVGAGTGDFSTLLLKEKLQSLTLVEPSEMFSVLSGNAVSDTVDVSCYHNVFSDVFGEIRDSVCPDTLVYINVLEHIENDRLELHLMHECLPPNGKALIFVPALSQLYGPFDRKIGHFRRYGRKELIGKASEAGFRVLRAKYFDLWGIFPWFVKYKLLGSDSLESGLIKVYDKLVVPVSRAIESRIAPPIGKNLLLILERP